MALWHKSPAFGRNILRRVWGVSVSFKPSSPIKLALCLGFLLCQVGTRRIKLTSRHSFED